MMGSPNVASKRNPMLPAKNVVDGKRGEVDR